MEIKDTGKDEVLDKLLENISVKEKQLLDNYTWLGESGRKELRERIKLMSANYNMLLAKRREPNRIKSYRDPTPQTPEQIGELYRLIDSV